MMAGEAVQLVGNFNLSRYKKCGKKTKNYWLPSAKTSAGGSKTANMSPTSPPILSLILPPILLPSVLDPRFLYRWESTTCVLENPPTVDSI